MNFPVNFPMNIPMNKILFATESDNCGLSHVVQLVLMWPCLLSFKGLASIRVENQVV